MVFAASRAVVLVAALVTATIASRFGDDLVTGRPYPAPSPTHLTLQALGSWDGGWYVVIAENGYPQSAGSDKPWAEFAFFPLFPLSIRAASWVTGLSATTAGVAVAMLFGAVAAVLLWVLARRLANAETADRAVALFSFFPGSIVLSMAYAEAMMLTFSLACLLALLTRRWAVAGLAAGLATATRPNAVALCACCAWAAGAAIARRREWRAVLAPLLSVTGMFAYFAFLGARTGDVLLWFEVQGQTWSERFDFGVGSWNRLRITVADPLDLHRPRDVNALLATVGLLLAVVGMYLLWRWRPPPVVTIYAVVVVLLALMSQTLGLRPRFVFTAFPLLMALAWRLRGPAFHAVLAGSAALVGPFLVLSVVTTYATP